MAYVVTEPCIGVKDKSCAGVCPVDCFYEDRSQLYIHPDECIDCGACAPECPVSAIFPADAVPSVWRSYIAKNAAIRTQRLAPARRGVLPPRPEPAPAPDDAAV